MNPPKKQKNKRLVLLDAHAILHRAYHALPDFSTAGGEPTGALYGVSAMLMKIIQDYSPDYIASCFDVAEPTYRHEAYEDYKAGRKKADEELVAQIKRSHDLLKALFIPIYEKSGFEADDILGTIVEQLKNEDLEIIIASGDMDTLQLVRDKEVMVFTLKRGINDTVLYDEDAVNERFGFGPELLPDYKGLSGDPSDNIIGVVGIGDKTATELITTFGSIEKIYENLEKDEEKLKEKGIKERVIKLLKEGKEEAEFSKMLATIRRDAPIKYTFPEKIWKDELDIEEVFKIFSDLEFRSLVRRAKEVFGAKQASIEELTETKDEISEKDLEELKVGVWLLDSTLTNPNTDDIKSFTKKKSLNEAKDFVENKLSENNLKKVFDDIEKPLIPIIKKMEEKGVGIDKKFLDKLSKEYHKELSKIEKKIFKEAGEEFNINSPKQLSEILFDKMGLSIKNHKKTGGGSKSTRESELEKLRDDHKIIDLILDYRELQKLLSTYIDNIPKMVDENDRLHATFLQYGTTTGRMASQDPNLQNIPIRSELGRKIRNAFVPAEGFSLVAFDYSQMELRIAAFLSGDSELIKIFKNGEDVHSAVASRVFEVPLERVDKEMRRKAKVINFGILYGMGVNALKANLGGTQKEAREFYNDYFNKFPELASYLEDVKAEVASRGYTETIFGRRRYFQGINSSIPYVRASAERMAINAPIQGTEADIIKKALIEIDGYLEKEKLHKQTYPVLQVHDELVYEISKDQVSKISSKIQEMMEGVISLKDTRNIPLSVEVQVGQNWGEMKKLF